ncbi:MAG: sel1 repeat family protein [Desulfovibrio sp.]|nr:sel1 repeat family protein [Desulfovibrio sp.]
MKGIFKLATALLACLPLLGAGQPAWGGKASSDIPDFILKKAEAGDPEAQNFIGSMYACDPVRQDWKKARAWYEKAAAQRHAKSINMLGLIYEQGLGVRQDYAKARAWFEKGATLNSAESLAWLGVMHADGLGTPQDYVKARAFFEKASEQGSASARRYIGDMFEQGLGVRQNRKTAKEWYGKACDGGDQDGCDAYRRLNEAGF